MRKMMELNKKESAINVNDEWKICICLHILCLIDSSAFMQNWQWRPYFLKQLSIGCLFWNHSYGRR